MACCAQLSKAAAAGAHARPPGSIGGSGSGVGVGAGASPPPSPSPGCGGGVVLAQAPVPAHGRGRSAPSARKVRSVMEEVIGKLLVVAVADLDPDVRQAVLSALALAPGAPFDPYLARRRASVPSSSPSTTSRRP